MNVMNITTCPTSTEVFRKRGIELECKVGKEYHCMMNEKKRHVELCISRSWIQPDHCPEYNTAANRIDVSACDASDGVCPPSIYWSNNSFLYSGCLPEQGTTNTGNPVKDSNDVLVISVVVSLVSLAIICIVCAVLFVIRRRKRQRSKTEEECLLSTGENTRFPLEEEIKKGRETIYDHRADDIYVPTHAAKKGKTILDEKNILVIQGITGCGKTKTALQVASEWMREDESSRKCVYLKSLDSLQGVTFHDNTCIILNGCFTRWVLDSSSTHVSKFCLRLHEQIKKHNLIYLIITVHKYIYSTHRSTLQKYDLFSNEHHLTLEYEDYEEKKNILTSHLTYTEDSTRNTLTEKEWKKLLSNCTKNVGFPSVCWMYKNIPEYEKYAFFRGCEFVLQKSIGSMKNSLKCCLFYAMLRSKVCEFDINDIDGECLNELKKECSCDKMTDEQLLECFGKDNPYFTSRGDNIFSFSQTVIYEACLKIWFQNERYRELFLRLCSLEQVKENIRDKTYKVESRACILPIKVKEFSLFAPRFASMMDEHKELGYHSLLQNEIFCGKVNEERKQDKNYPVKQKEIPDVHINWENRPLLPGEKLPEQEKWQPEQQQERQQQQQEQHQQQHVQHQKQQDQNQQQQDQNQQQHVQHQQQVYQRQEQQVQNQQQQEQHQQQQDQQQVQRKSPIKKRNIEIDDCRPPTSNEENTESV